MKEIGTSHLDQREQRIREFVALDQRRKWLLFHHKDFLAEFEETEKRIGLNLKGKIWSLPIYDWGGSNQVALTGNPLELTGFNVLWEDMWNLLDDTAKKFLRKYDLLPFSLEDFEYKFDVLTAFVKAGKCTFKATTFWQHADWYELSQKGMTTREIVDYLAEKDPVYVDANILNILRSNEKKDCNDYKNLCKLAKISGHELDQKTVKKLLISLGRLWAEEAKTDYENIAKKGRKYYVHCDMKLPKEVFDQMPPTPVSKSLRRLLEEFLRQQKIYLSKGGQAEKTIEKELRRMKDRIENLYQEYN